VVVSGIGSKAEKQDTNYIILKVCLAYGIQGNSKL